MKEGKIFSKKRKILAGDRVKNRSYFGNITTSESGSWAGFTKNSWSFELLGRESLAGAAFAHYINTPVDLLVRPLSSHPIFTYLNSSIFSIRVKIIYDTEIKSTTKPHEVPAFLPSLFPVKNLSPCRQKTFQPYDSRLSLCQHVSLCCHDN